MGEFVSCARELVKSLDIILDKYQEFPTIQIINFFYCNQHWHAI